MGGFDDIRGRIYFNLRKKLWFLANDWMLAGQFLDTPQGYLMVTAYACRHVMRHARTLHQCVNLGFTADTREWLRIIEEKHAIWETEARNMFFEYVEVYGYMGLPDIDCDMFNTRDVQETRYDVVIRNLCAAFEDSNVQVE